MGLGGVLGWHEKNPTQKKDTKKTVFFLLLKKHVFSKPGGVLFI